VVVVGSALGRNFVELGDFGSTKETDFVGSFATWDGEHYARIAREGYIFDPERRSNIAFFPAFPLAGRLVSRLMGLSAEAALLFVAYAFLLSAFAVTTLYVTPRPPARSLDVTIGSQDERAANSTERSAFFTLLAMGFFPTTFYFRMAYSESMFLFEVIVVLLGINRKWPLWAVAAIVGLATATRAAGVVMLVPLLGHVWHESKSFGIFLAKTIAVVPLASWGLAAFMAFQYFAFDDPLAFAKTQRHWDERPPISLAERLWLELTLEPFWCEYDPSCQCHQIHASADVWYFNMYLANPVYLALFASLLAFGALRGWLNRPEVLMGAALLLFSYLTKSYATCMASQARFASTVFPVYLVMGRLLQSMPPPVVGMVIAIFTFFLASYSALFVRWHCLY
jgi:hypothetical protein